MDVGVEAVQSVEQAAQAGRVLLPGPPEPADPGPGERADRAGRGHRAYALLRPRHGAGHLRVAESGARLLAEREPRGPMTGFPPGFLWGAATAAYQIEGAVDEDGRGPSIWDTFCRTPGTVAQRRHRRRGCRPLPPLPRGRRADGRAGRGRLPVLGGLAADPARRAGARPTRPGSTSTTALVDELLAAGIAPMATLYHWDLPQALEDAGGWPERDTATGSPSTRRSCTTRWATGCGTWTTLNEPWCSAFLGYASGVHAPGRPTPAAALPPSHHLLLGHGLAVGAPAGAPAPATRRHHAQPRAGPRPATDDAEPTSTRPGASTGCEPACSSTRCCAAQYPADVLADLPSGRRDSAFVRTATCDDHRARRSTCSASTTTSRRWSPARRPPGAGGRSASPARWGPVATRSPRRTAADGDGLGGGPHGPAATCCSACTATTRACPIRHHRERRGLRRPGRRRRRRPRRRPDRLPARAPRGRGSGRSRRARTCAATSPGR